MSATKLPGPDRPRNDGFSKRAGELELDLRRQGFEACLEMKISGMSALDDHIELGVLDNSVCEIPT